MISRHDATAARSRESALLFLSVSAPVLLLYLLTQCDALSPAHDSMWYLRMIEDGRYFHPHHLLYNAAAALWAHAWQSVIPSLQTLTLTAWLNGVFGALSVGIVALLLHRRAGIGRAFSSAAALLPAFSFGVWFYSVTIEVYIPALFFILAALYVLTIDRLTATRIVAAAALHGVAMLFHQLHILFILPAILIAGGWMSGRGTAATRQHAGAGDDADAQGNDGPGSDARDSDARGSDARGSDARGSDARDSDARGSDALDAGAQGDTAPRRWLPVEPGWPAVLLYAVTAGLIVLIPYILVGVVALGHGTPAAFMEWVTGYADDGHYWQPIGAATPLKILLGFSRSIIGADFLFALESVSGAIQHLLSGKWLADQEFVVRGMPDILAYALIALSAVFALLLIVRLAGLIRFLWHRRRRMDAEPFPPLFRIALVFFLAYTAFFSVWDTTNVEFWIPQSVLAWIMFAILLHRARQEEAAASADLDEAAAASADLDEEAAAGADVFAASDAPADALPSDDGRPARPSRGRIPVLLPLLAALLLLINGAGSIAWMMPSENDYYYIQAESLTDISGEGGIVMLPDRYMMEHFLAPDVIDDAVIVSELLRACGGDASCAMERASARIDRVLQRGRAVAVDRQCVHPEEFARLQGGEGYAVFVALFTARYGDRLQNVQTPTGPMYRISP